MRFPQVSSRTAIRTGPASLGSRVNRMPALFSLSNSAFTSSTWKEAAGMPSSTRATVLETQSLGRQFTTGPTTTVALDQISILVRQREFVSVIGPSGCGKSTLIRILAGLDQPSATGRYRNATSNASMLTRFPVSCPASRPPTTRVPSQPRAILRASSSPGPPKLSSQSVLPLPSSIRWVSKRSHWASQGLKPLPGPSA